MKETKPTHKQEVREVRPHEISRQKKFIGSVAIKPGHRLFKVDKRMLEITEVETEADAHLTESGAKVKKSVTYSEDFYYIAALNKKNVNKRLRKALGL